MSLVEAGEPCKTPSASARLRKMHFDFVKSSHGFSSLVVYFREGGMVPDLSQH